MKLADWSGKVAVLLGYLWKKIPVSHLQDEVLVRTEFFTLFK